MAGWRCNCRGSPEALDEFVRAETDKWAKAVKASGAKVD